MANDLKPCPFCGDPMENFHGVIRHANTTDERGTCPIEIHAWDENFLPRWNHRALPPLPADLAGLREQADKLRGDLEAHNFDDAVTLIDTALEALAGRQVAVPEGWKLVPVEPTDAMIDASDTAMMYAKETDGEALTVWNAMLTAASPAPQAAEEHPDDAAVDRFAAAMKAKMKWAREHRGRSGWDDPKVCTPEYLARHLVEHLAKGNPGTFEDVANFCMMLHQRGCHPAVLAEAFSTPPASGKVEAEAVAWTGSGSITVMEWGREGYIWPSKADAHPIPLYSEATIAAMQAEIERLTRLHQASIRAVKKLRERAEAAEAELAKLQGKIEKIALDMPESHYRTQLRALLKGETE